jgi:hypothetical protein
MLTFKEFLEGLPAIKLGPPPTFEPAEPEGEIVQFPAQDYKVSQFGDVPGGKIKDGKFEPKRTLGIPREKMPQLKSREEFIQWLQTNGIGVQRILMAPKDSIRDPLTKEKRVGHAHNSHGTRKSQKIHRKGNHDEEVKLF